eukprot:gene1829-52420_t
MRGGAPHAGCVVRAPDGAGAHLSPNDGALPPECIPAPAADRGPARARSGDGLIRLRDAAAAAAGAR